MKNPSPGARGGRAHGRVAATVRYITTRRVLGDDLGVDVTTDVEPLGKPARNQRWCTGHEYVDRPATVRRIRGAPSRGHGMSRSRGMSPVWEPPRRSSTRRV